MAGEAGKDRKVVLVTEKAFASEAVTAIEKIFAEAKYNLVKCENYKSKDEMLAAVADADAIIIRSDIVDASVLEAAKKLKIVVRAGAGYDNIDLKACHAASITAMNTPGQNANAVAELVMAMMLCQARNNFDGTSGTELTKRTIAFYGFGAVARAVFKLCKGFDMECSAYDPYIPKEAIESQGAKHCATVEELFQSQYVSLHVPLTPETKESMNKAMLSKMPKGGTLINTARSEVVHEKEMLELLKERPDMGYLCDVGVKDLDAFKEVLGDKFMKRGIFTKKKMGAQTTEANNNAGVAAANQIIAFFEKGVTKFSLGPDA